MWVQYFSWGFPSPKFWTWQLLGLHRRAQFPLPKLLVLKKVSYKNGLSVWNVCRFLSIMFLVVAMPSSSMWVAGRVIWCNLYLFSVREKEHGTTTRRVASSQRFVAKAEVSPKRVSNLAAIVSVVSSFRCFVGPICMCVYIYMRLRGFRLSSASWIEVCP